MAGRKKDDAEQSDAAASDFGASQLQKTFDEAHAKGHFGESVDPTPRSHYTVSGVLAGKPTPETDYDSAVEAVKVRVAGVEGVQPPS